MVAPTGGNEQVRYDILINAKAAIAAMKDIMRHTQDNAEKMRLFSALVLDSSERWGVSWQKALAIYRQLNAELAKSKKATLFGQTGGKDLFTETGKVLAASDEIRRAQTQVAKGAEEMGNSVENAGRRGARGIDAMRIALGVLVSMLIFNVIAAIQNAFRTMIDNLREAELAVYNLINAERRLSEEGIDVTPEGLQETVDAVRELVPVLSQIQAEELVSRIATNVAPALKLTNEQIRQMAEATALLYIRNKALGKSFDEVEAQLTNAFLTGKVSQGINNLGVKLSDQIVRDEALRMGLVETEKEFDNLTGEMEAQVKATAMLSVVYQNATQDVESMGEYMKTTDAQIDRAKTAWNDLLTIVGKFSGPALATVFRILGDSLQGWIKMLTVAKPIILDFIATVSAGFQMLGYLMQNPLTNLTEFADQFAKFKQENLDSLMFELDDAIDTPTGTPEFGGINTDEALADLEELEQAIEDIKKKTAEDLEDLSTNLERKLADLDEEYRRKSLDAEQDYLRKVEDINRDYERDIQNLKEKQREEDIRDEEKYQLALWELRMRFLMNLEDALHARDARQVLRLQRQYAIDKEALERKHALDTKEREQNQKEELEDAEQRKQERLEDARLEYQQKLADLNLAKQREQQDLQLWYEREQADIALAQQRKLETLLKGWMDEKKITEANAAEVYGILLKYFGPGGLTDELYRYMAQSLAANTVNAVNGVLSQLGSLGARDMSTPVPTPVIPGSVTRRRTDDRPIPKFAEGGSLLATRPTTATFGEGGPELVNFTPLSRVGKNVGKLFGDTSGMGGVNGTIRVAVDLSPDLTGRIVEQSMDGVAEVLSKVNRSKF